jgi:hypothetical protein
MIQFDKDKQLHFYVGLAIGAGAFIIAPQICFTLGCAIAIGKEVYDYFHPKNHTSDVTDALCTIAGVSIGIAATNIFQRF